MKTHSGWTIEPAASTERGVPTAYTWTSSTGFQFRADSHGTTPIEPDP